MAGHSRCGTSTSRRRSGRVATLAVRDGRLRQRRRRHPGPGAVGLARERGRVDRRGARTPRRSMRSSPAPRPGSPTTTIRRGDSPTGSPALRDVDPDAIDLAIDWLDALHPPRRPRRRRARTPIGSAVTMLAAGVERGVRRRSTRWARANGSPFGRLDRQDVFGDADGRGVTVAIVDSGVDGDHPAVRGPGRPPPARRPRRRRGDRRRRSGGPRPRRARDRVRRHRGGHRPRGRASCRSACSAPTTAARVEPSRPPSTGRSGQGIAVVNLSLSSRSEAMFSAFHALADRSYFANSLLVCAANNVPGPSYPSLFASVVSVAAHDVADPDTWFYNPSPPVEFGALRSRRRCRVARRRSHPRDGQLVRRAAPGRSGRPTAVALSDGVALRDQGAPRRDGHDPDLNRNRPAGAGRCDVGDGARRVSWCVSSSSSVGVSSPP